MRGTAVTSGSLLERESSLGVILMLPGALLLMLFMAYPFFLGIWLSLTDSGIGRMGSFIGLRNFSDLLTDTIFHQTAWNTLIYGMVTVPFKAALGLGLALVLNQHMRFSNPVRAAVMMPWIVPTALSTLGWFMIFDPVFSPFSWLFKHLGLIKHEAELAVGVLDEQVAGGGLFADFRLEGGELLVEVVIDVTVQDSP